MSGSSAKEQRRNLRKEIGETAAAAVDRVEQLGRMLETQHRALALELAELKRAVPAGQKAIEARIDALGAWCQQLEERQQDQLRALLTLVQLEAGARLTFETMSLWRRLRWIATGGPAALPGDTPNNEPGRTADSPATRESSSPPSVPGIAGRRDNNHLGATEAV